MMRLKVLLPTQVFLDTEVGKVTAEAENGFFCLLPKHVDFVAALVPGLLSYELTDGHEEFIGIGEGVLVKRGTDVLVSTKDGVTGPDLGLLVDAVRERYQRLREREESAQAAVSKFEADFLSRFLELEKGD
jgi:F-type H+-transporting ATPase subunit epsilon